MQEELLLRGPVSLAWLPESPLTSPSAPSPSSSPRSLHVLRPRLGLVFCSRKSFLSSALRSDRTPRTSARDQQNLVVRELCLPLGRAGYPCCLEGALGPPRELVAFLPGAFWKSCGH